MKKLTQILDKVIETVILVLVASMVLGNFWQIFTRMVMNNAASWTEEYLRYALIWLTMLGVPYAYSRNQHIAIEFVVDSFSRKGKRVNQLFIVKLIQPVKQLANRITRSSCVLSMYYDVRIQESSHVHILQVTSRLMLSCIRGKIPSSVCMDSSFSHSGYDKQQMLYAPYEKRNPDK